MSGGVYMKAKCMVARTELLLLLRWRLWICQLESWI